MAFSPVTFFLAVYISSSFPSTYLYFVTFFHLSNLGSLITFVCYVSELLHSWWFTFLPYLSYDLIYQSDLFISLYCFKGPLSHLSFDHILFPLHLFYIPALSPLFPVPACRLTCLITTSSLLHRSREARVGRGEDKGGVGSRWNPGRRSRVLLHPAREYSLPLTQAGWTLVPRGSWGAQTRYLALSYSPPWPVSLSLSPLSPIFFSSV